MEPDLHGPTPAAPLDLPEARVRAFAGADGGSTLYGLPDRPATQGPVAEWLDCAAMRAPSRPFLVAPGLCLSLDEAAGLTDGLAQALIDRGLGPGRPLMLHGAGDAAALALQFAAVKAGVPTLLAPAAPARLAADATPGLVYAPDSRRADAVRDVFAMIGATPPELVVGYRGVDRLMQTPPTVEIVEARERTPPDHVLAVYPPPARAPGPHPIVATRRSVALATAALAAAWPFASARPPLVLTAGDPVDPCGSGAAVRLAAAASGTVVLHGARAASASLSALFDAAGASGPTLVAEPAAALSCLLDAAEADAHFADRLASRLDAVWVTDRPADAALAERLDRFGRRTRGERIALLDTLSLPETAGPALWRRVEALADEAAAAGPFYWPLPGLAARAAPAAAGGLALRGGMVGPAWFGASDEARVWDAEGFRRTGVGARLARADEPAHGVLLDPV